MPIHPTNPFKGRQYPGELIVLCVRWYLRYPLSYEHVSELMAERGVEVDASCLCRVLLERRGTEEHNTHAFIFAEQEMSSCAKDQPRIAASLRSRKDRR